MTNKHIQALDESLRELATLASVSALAAWDQETYMVSGAASARSEQLELLARLVHERRTSAQLDEHIAACEEDASLREDEPRQADLRELRRDYERAVRLPAELVSSLAGACSRGQELWKRARAESDFSLFEPALTQILALTRRKAECLGVPAGGELYDALLDEYEPGASAAEVAGVFQALRAPLASLIAEVAGSAQPPDERPLAARAEPARQADFGRFVLAAMGFDFTSGRLDTTTHPFCTGIAPGDTRLTTRYDSGGLFDSLFGTLHEGGHGLYEQGLPKRQANGWPACQAVSLGMHESQSRLWENLVGRSREFWSWALPHARERLSSDLAAYSPEDVYRAVNTARASFVRVGADEATYNLHVMLRFELERALISGELAVPDLPAAWNERFRESLGLEVPDDARGCLQDVHWALGLVGYFPTYTLGNLYAAQLWEALVREQPELPLAIAAGDFASLLQWLRTSVHRHGRRYPARELIERTSGAALTPEPFLRYLEGKIRPIYGL